MTRLSSKSLRNSLAALCVLGLSMAALYARTHPLPRTVLTSIPEVHEGVARARNAHSSPNRRSRSVPSAVADGSVRSVVLRDAFRSDFMIGAALNRRQIFEEDKRGAAIVSTQFNSITPENVLKWALVHPEPGRYDFAAPDRFVEFGTKRKMFVVGHTLVWHNQTPRWVFEDGKGNAVDRETLLKRMREHIFTVVGRYKGRINGWDVVNEALNQDGTMRQSPWFKIIGDDYLVQAFKFAHEADPNAELYYNDYDLELPAKRAGGVELIKKLKAAGVPIAGVGLQNHNLMDWPSVADEDATITAFEQLAVKVNITELDVDVLPRTTKPGADYAVDVPVTPQLNPYVDRLPDAQQLALAKRYAELFQVYVKHRDAVDRVTFWGVADGDSWLNNWPMKGRTNYPLLFDRFGRPKPALAAVINVKSNSLNCRVEWEVVAETREVKYDIPVISKGSCLTATLLSGSIAADTRPRRTGRPF